MFNIKKLREAIYMIRHRKDFKKVEIEVLMENQKFIEELQNKNKLLKNDLKNVRTVAAQFLEENNKSIEEIEKLKEKIEELEGNNERWNMLDL